MATSFVTSKSPFGKSQTVRSNRLRQSALNMVLMFGEIIAGRFSAVLMSLLELTEFRFSLETTKSYSDSSRALHCIIRPDGFGRDVCDPQGRYRV